MALALLAAVSACVPLRTVTVDVPVALTPNATATADLPRPANYVNRAAGVRLRFADAPFHKRGGSSWNYRVDFTMTPLSNGAAAGPAQSSSLTIYRGMDRESFEALAVMAPLAADSVQIAVTGVNSIDPTALPTDLKLNLELSGERAVAFQRKVAPTIAQLQGPTVAVAMTSIPDGTVSYEFEWVFFDREERKPTDPFAEREPVRIANELPVTVVDTSYPDGALYVRARAIGRFGTAESGARRVGEWSNVLRIALGPGGLEKDANWRYTAAYAESVGFASGIEYFDGAYRTRQRQTRTLGPDARVIAETKYDGEGRPAVTFLPAPAPGSRLEHADAFNKVDTPGGPTPTRAYDTAQFEGIEPAPASATSGAGQYYSASAALSGPADAYVADARGYPYSIVERARDNSGRQRERSGTGAPLRLGGGHESLLRYGSASSSPLRRLFGANVGSAAYYDRNVVIDANRRADVNYVDRSGNVIASALTGSPANLESIAPANLPLMTYRLDENNLVDAHAGMSRSVNRIAIESGTDVFFSYDLNGAQYSVPAAGAFPPLCESCRYHLQVRIVGPRGPVSLRAPATVQSDPSCDNGPLQSQIAEDLGDATPPPNFCAAGAGHAAVTATSATQSHVGFCAKLTEPGEYEVIKELTVVDGAVDAIVTRLTSTPGTFDITTFRPDATVVGRQCPGDCGRFCAKVDTEHRQQCLAACRRPLDWATSAVATDSCTSLTELIKADVGPRGILAGTPLTAHPEYCQIFKASPVTPSLCQRTIASNQFDYRMMSVNTWNEALCRGYLDPLGTPGAPARPATCTGLAERDPFTDPTQIGVSMRAWALATLQDYTGNMPGFSTLPQQPPPPPPPAVQPHLSIWQMAAQPIYPSTSPPSDDERWRMFRSLYMGVKQTAIARYLEDPNGGACPYWNDRHAHVKRPFTFTSTQQAQDAATDEQAAYCADLCPSRAAQWIGDLETACETTIPTVYKAQRLAPGLRQYCTRTCSATNPLPAITSDLVNTDPSLVQAVQPTPQYQLPAACTLDRLVPQVQPPLAAGQGPVAIGNYTPAVGDQPGDVIGNVVHSAFEFPPPAVDTDLCKDGANEWADQLALIELTKAKQELETFVERRHYQNCFGPQLKEAFSYQARQGEYQFTLRYYDQAGNLVQTVPPAGVRPLNDAQLADLERGTAVNGPQHKLLTQYRYNSLGEVIYKNTPDGGEKTIWYNAQGQLRLSQNAQQKLDARHAYVRYDDRGRIVETGLAANPPDAAGVAAPLDPALLQRYADTRTFPDAGYTREQVVTTSYDEPAPECQALSARNLRGRVAAILATTTIGVIATCYSYDVHGNTAALSHTVLGLGTKTISYDYDVLDGKLRASHYQAGASDALHHRYRYDLDRRLATVETSRDGELWERDAAYSYYRHGPLARIELGADRVQGLDYLYSISSWPKGINSDTLSADRDPGGDARANSTNAAVARDAFGSAVHYFTNDYLPASAAGLGARMPQAATSDSVQGVSALASAACPNATAGTCGLYDGTITGTISTIAPSPLAGSGALGTAYRYDQLYRLRSSTTFTDLDGAGNRWPTVSTDPNFWRTQTQYDPNGNIDHLTRSSPDAQGNAALMDDLSYDYPRNGANELTANRLLRVEDMVAAGDYPDDVDTQPPDNYRYDASGRPTRDGAAGLNAIRWNAAGQIAALDRIDDTVEFVYDGLGRRVAKVVRAGTDATRWQYEYFVRDAQGEILATYESQAPAAGAAPEVVLKSQTLRGASRLGTWTATNAPALTVLGPAAAGGTIQPPPGGLVAIAPIKRYARVRGDKQYELANYLGNVEATVSDRKRPVELNGAVTRYEAQLVSSRGYYPFGALLPSVGSAAQGYRFGFSGFERDDELRGAGNSYYTQARMFDPRLGRWLSPDSLDHAGTSPFVGFANNPLRFTDPQGTDDKDAVKLEQLKAAIASDLRSRDWWQKSMMQPSPEAAAQRQRAEGPRLSAADSPYLVRPEKFGLGTDRQNEMMQSAVQAPLIAASAGFIAGPAVGAGVMVFQSGTNLGNALKSGDPVNIGLATLGVLADVYAVSQVPAPPRQWKVCSFAPDTPVITAHGPVPIEEIRAGDEVVSFDEVTGQKSLRPVDLAYSSVHSSSLRLAIGEADGATEQLVTTIEHPFWTEGNGWTPAGKIATGARVLGANGWRTVTHVERIPGEVRTFNLTIDDLHTFMVGTDGLWVHNACPWQPIQEGEWAPFEDFVRRSVPYDELQGHELWSHANIKALGLAGPRRLSSAVSRANPVIAVDDVNHSMVNTAQSAVDVTKMTPYQDIMRNTQQALDLGLSSPAVIKQARDAAIDLAKSTGKLHQVPP